MVISFVLGLVLSRITAFLSNFGRFGAYLLGQQRFKNRTCSFRRSSSELIFTSWGNSFKTTIEKQDFAVIVAFVPPIVFIRIGGTAHRNSSKDRVSFLATVIPQIRLFASWGNILKTDDWKKKTCLFSAVPPI